MSTCQRIYYAMKQFDFTPVIETALREYKDLDKSKAENLLDALLQWFSLVPVLEDGKALQMINSVDRLWHAFILNSRLYRMFCDKFFGYYFDHDPNDVILNPQSLKREYAEYTLHLLIENFGYNLNPLLKDLSGDVTCCGVLGCKDKTHTFRNKNLELLLATI